MEDIIKNFVEKISSYDILNNLFPGVIFCSIVERTTRITRKCTQAILTSMWKINLIWFTGLEPAVQLANSTEETLPWIWELFSANH